jgi:beta-lactamase superfamily II metal-dependent hydrolase
MKPRARLPLALGLALIVGQASAQQPRSQQGRTATIEILDVGQGDSILIRSAEGKTALIDAGPSHNVVELLKRRGVKSIDLAVVSHHHVDHYGGMAAVVRAFKPRFFLASGSSHTTPHYLRLLELVRDQGIQAIQPTDRPRRIELGAVILMVFPQAPENRTDENNNSVGIRLQYGTFAVLLPGDAEATERGWWERTVPDLCRNCAVLKLAHHGSRNGTDARWLELVQPSLAIASMGRSNEFGHPHAETLSLLRHEGIPLLRTDQNGTVAIETDGRTSRVVGHDLAAKGPPEKGHARLRHDSEVKPVGRLININTATEAELESLPRVGPVIARRIIEGRPYRSVDDLERVKGIGRKRLEQIRPMVKVE